jgi:hypothetical protein
LAFKTLDLLLKLEHLMKKLWLGCRQQVMMFAGALVLLRLGSTPYRQLHDIFQLLTAEY